MDDPIGRWFLMVFLFLCAFLVKLLSSALKAANDGKLRQRDGKALSRLLDAPQNALSALALARLFCLTGISVTATLCFAGNLWQALATVLLLTLVFTVVLTLMPSLLGRRHADTLVASLHSVYRFFGVLFLPFTFINGKLSWLALRLFGIKPTASKEEVTEDEIRAMVDIGQESGTIEGDERDMIENVFDFGDLTAADCMTHRTDVTALWIGDDEKTIADTIEESGLSRFPVYDEDIDDVIGILFSRDFLLNAAKNGEEKKPLRALLREPYFVPETVKADTLLRNMQHAKTHMAVVVDEYGGVSGLVTMEDLLEEIVGDIYDEFDPADDETEIRQIAPDTYRVGGAATLDALNEALNISLPESEDYDTLGGLFLSRFSEIPEDGATPETDVYVTPTLEKPDDAPCDTLHIKVEQLEDRRVERALITKGRYTPPLPQPDDDD